MLGRIQKGFIVSLLVIVIGGHWAILQGAAWAGMLMAYSKDATLSQAWTKTFDGHHPCKLCKLIRAGKAAEKKQEMVKCELSFEFPLLSQTAWLFPPRPSLLHTPASLVPPQRVDAPLLPPPIAS